MISAFAGRIQRVLILNHEHQPIPDGEKAEHLYTTLLDYYRDLFIKLPSGIPAEFFILFDLNNPFFPEGLLQNYRTQCEGANVCIYCTNYNEVKNHQDPDCTRNTIPSCWVQDWIIPDKGSEWYFSNPADGLPVDIQHKLNKLLKVKFTELPGKCDGGNLLAGSQDGINYLLVGGYEHTSIGTAKLKKLFGIDTANIIRITPKLENEQNEHKDLFHLDLFVTILGSVRFPFAGNPDVLLVARARGKQSRMDSVNETIEYAMADLKKRDFPRFVGIDIPFLLLDDFNLSYNNCHVQNYMDGKTRRISVCFPSYEKALKEKAKLLLLNKKSKLIALRQNIQLLLQNSPGTSTIIVDEKDVIEQKLAMDEDEFMNELFDEIEMLDQQIQDEIKEILSAIGVDTIQFIQCRFYEDSAPENGSLHCMSLVIARE